MGIIVGSIAAILVLMPVLIYKVWPNIFLAILILAAAIISHGYINHYSFMKEKRAANDSQPVVIMGNLSENDSKRTSKSDYKKMFLYINESYGWLFIFIYFLLVVLSIWIVKKYV